MIPPSLIDKADAIADRLLAIALAVPLLIISILLAGALVSPAAAEDMPGTCGTDLRSTLSAGQKAEIAEAASSVAVGEGIFWKIEKEGVEPSYLLGTIHLPDPRVTELPEPVADALEAADRTILELAEVANPEAIAGLMFTMPDILMLPGDQTLQSLLSEEQYQTVSDGLAKKGVPIATMNKLQPWFISIGLATPDCAALAKSDPAAALDSVLAIRAEDSGQEVIGLETVEEQLSIMGSLPLETQVEQLVATMGYLDQVNDMMETMIAIYEDETIGTLMPTLQALFPDAGAVVGGNEAFAQFEEELIGKRNLLMVDRMIPFLEEGNSFVGVGALHLIGEGGVVAGLRDKGWTVTRQPLDD